MDAFRSAYLKCYYTESLLDAEWRWKEKLIEGNANGAIHLAGFVVECLLKASLMEKRRWLETAGSCSPDNADKKRLWSLADRVLSADEQMLVSMILTLTPTEAKGS